MERYDLESTVLPALLAAAVVTLMAPYAAAQSSSNEWQFAIAPYVWLAGMDGSLDIGGHEAGEGSVDFDNIVDSLDFAFMGHFDMRNEHWVISSDLVFIDLGGSRDYTEGDDTLGTVSTGFDATLFELVGGYRVSPAVTLLAGARLVDLGVSVGWDGTLEDRRIDANESFVDPLVGVHVLAPLSEKWWFGLRGDVGGFGVGSQLTWQAYADIGFRVSRLVSFIAGYHALDMDYESGTDAVAVDLDVLVSGPQIAVAFTF
jgi:hypothetical protein